MELYLFLSLNLLFVIFIAIQAFKIKKLEAKFNDYVKNNSNLRGKLQNLENTVNEINTNAKRQSVTEVLETDENLESDNIIELKIETSENSVSNGLLKTRKSFFDKLKNIFSNKKINEESFDEIEQLLFEADLGTDFVTSALSELKENRDLSEDNFLEYIKSKISNSLDEKDINLVNNPSIILMLGVNGVGKTTTSAKLANIYKNQGKKVMLVAADTFRAAAVEQIKIWGERINVDVVSGAENAKPQTVVFSALEKAKNENYDVIIIDTAGRLHNKSNLMLELEGINNAIKKFYDRIADESLLVLDACTGQNAIIQAKEFNEAVPLTGLVLTKLDGTPRGGIVVAINQQLGIPVKLLGIGEGINELKVFNKQDFVDALFDKPLEEVETSANAEVRRIRRS